MKAWIAGSFAAFWIGVSLSPVWAADDVQFTATIDRSSITQDDSVSLKMTVRTEGMSSVEMPSFQAPDFQVINEYTGTFVESYYENGRFGARNNQQITRVLRPLKTGNLKITNIQVRVSGKNYSAAPLSVEVTPGGAGTPPPRHYGGGGAGLRGVQKRAPGNSLFVRAEIDKQKVYKGQQIVVSYYLYQRVRAFNIQVEKYPAHTGFFREELEMPIQGQRLDTEQVVLDGTPYARSLLARYAVYPLKEGKLTIDPMALKASYYGGSSAIDDDDPFMTFFKQMSPRMTSSRSEPISIEVQALPESGRPANFSGGVGEFSVTSAVDRYDVRANEAVNLTLKVEGRGNLATIQEPKAKWPDNIELYEAKGHAKSGRGGVGEKVFEFLLIPRVPGKVVLPGLEISYFDTAKQAYVTKTTEPVSINVGSPAPGSAVNPVLPKQKVGSLHGPGAAEPPKVEDLHYLKPPVETSNGLRGHPWWRWLYWLSILSFGGFVGLVASDAIRRSMKRARETSQARLLSQSKSWQNLRGASREAVNGASWQEVVLAYERLSGAVYDVLDSAYGIGVRSIARSDLRRTLVEDGHMDDALWQRVDRLLEFAETVRFAISAGAVSESLARSQLSHWVAEGEALDQILSKNSKKL